MDRFFLFASIQKAWYQLEEEKGRLAIHITNIGNNKPYADLIHLFVQVQFDNCLFVKTILLSGGKNTIPIWVWKKTSNTSSSDRYRIQSKAREWFRLHYPNIWKKVVSLKRKNNNN